MPTDFLSLSQAVVDGDADRARALAHALVADRADLLQAIEQGFAAGIRKVGELWEEGEYFLPELVQGAEAMGAAMEVLKPALQGLPGAGARGRVVIGTVQGDLHDIGKTLVATLLSANGFEVHDLGSDVPVARFVDQARALGAHVVAASALLTTTMPVQGEIARALREQGIPARMLVGGAPTSSQWATSIGAAWAENALQAVQVTRGLVGP